MGAGFFGGAYLMLVLPGYLKSAFGFRIGSWYVAFFAIGAILGGGLPWMVFKYVVPVKCPKCGNRMKIQRIVLPQRYEQQVPRTGSVYQCISCGTTK